MPALLTSPSRPPSCAPRRRPRGPARRRPHVRVNGDHLRAELLQLVGDAGEPLGRREIDGRDLRRFAARGGVTRQPQTHRTPDPAPRAGDENPRAHL